MTDAVHVLDTRRLTPRWLKPADARFIFELTNDPDWLQHIGDRGIRSLDDARYDQVRRWVDACIARPVAQQVGREEVVKLYYDCSKGAGNGALLPGRRQSSFTFDPDWRSRPWPPRNKCDHDASDAELGL